MQHIVCKIQIVSREGSAHKVIPVCAQLRKFLEFRDDQIIASLSVSEGAHSVIDFLAAVEA